MNNICFHLEIFVGIKTFRTHFFSGGVKGAPLIWFTQSTFGVALVHLGQV